MKTIYLVTGETSYDYGESTYWRVRAFLNKNSAEALVLLLNKWCLEQGIAYGDCGANTFWKARNEGCPLDEKFECASSGTRYAIEELELADL